MNSGDKFFNFNPNEKDAPGIIRKDYQTSAARYVEKRCDLKYPSDDVDPNDSFGEVVRGLAPIVFLGDGEKVPCTTTTHTLPIINTHIVENMRAEAFETNPKVLNPKEVLNTRISRRLESQEYYSKMGVVTFNINGELTSNLFSLFNALKVDEKIGKIWEYICRKRIFPTVIPFGVEGKPVPINLYENIIHNLEKIDYSYVLRWFDRKGDADVAQALSNPYHRQYYIEYSSQVLGTDITLTISKIVEEYINVIILANRWDDELKAAVKDSILESQINDPDLPIIIATGLKQRLGNELGLFTTIIMRIVSKSIETTLA